MFQMDSFLGVNLQDTILYRVLNLCEHIVAIAVDNLNKFTHLSSRIRQVLSFTFCHTFLLVITSKSLSKYSHQWAIS